MNLIPSFLRLQLDRRPLAELTRVIATREIREGDDLAPKGARGTIMLVYDGGKGYEIEFTSPVHAVVSVESDAIRAWTR